MMGEGVMGGIWSWIESRDWGAGGGGGAEDDVKGGREGEREAFLWM